MNELEKLKAKVEGVAPDGSPAGLFEAMLDHERQQSRGMRESWESWRSFSLRLATLVLGAFLFYRFGLETLPDDAKDKTAAAKELLTLLFAFLAGFGTAKGDAAIEKKP